MINVECDQSAYSFKKPQKKQVLFVANEFKKGKFWFQTFYEC